ncbi:hypothetical protein ACHAWU_001702 [Discostella pseudostelligera]|uniref:SET domain-containing protein n=1 Tax=Discostella pseudostelligera TaxID=259834 RepID=A0ABD3MDE1_9STRA
MVPASRMKLHPILNSNSIAAVLVVGLGGLFGYLIGYYAPIIDGYEFHNGGDNTKASSNNFGSIAEDEWEVVGCDDSGPKNPHCAPRWEPEEADTTTTTTILGDGSLPIGQCGLYLAPSSIPYAGLGLYSGSPFIPHEHSVNEYIGGTFPGYDDESDPPLWTDLYVPIADSYKALPYRGQQRFPSWLQYIWPEEPGAMSDFDTKPFPYIPQHMWDFDQGLDSADGLDFFLDDYIDEASLEWRTPEIQVNAFVPGLASLVNHHSRFSNMVRIRSKSRRDYVGQVAPWQAGAGAFTPHHNVEFSVTKKGGIHEGMELVRPDYILSSIFDHLLFLLNYGDAWNRKNKEKLEWIAFNNKKQKQGVRTREGFVDGIAKKWDHVDKRELKNCPKELPTEQAKRDRLAEGKAADSSEFKDGEKPYSQYRDNDFHPTSWSTNNDTAKPFSWSAEGEDDDNDDGDFKDVQHYTEIIKPLSWLDQNGVCLSSGKLKVGTSPIKYAGRGLFSTTSIGEGEVVLTSPLIAMREEDFIIYKTDSTQTFVRDIIDKTIVVGQELLLNYAFTHPDSPLHLVPNAPLANFINHGGEEANVKVRWPTTGSNSAKLFQWAYKQEHGDHFDNDFETTNFNDPNPWLKDHPIDVMERSGKLALEYVALRDIEPGEEILLDYGELWQTAWKEHKKQHPYARSAYFRHAIGVPSELYPDNWLHVSDKYEIAEIQDLENNPLVPGKAMPMTWAHNGKPVGSKYAYVVGLEKGFSDKFLEYSEKKGVVELYRKLLTEQEGYHLPSDGFGVYHPATLLNSTTEGDAFFAHRYHSTAWRFNMHFVAAWEESARKDVLKALGDAGFDIALKGIGERFGYDNMTCFHASYMGVTHCDKSKMHSDIYATDDKSWNIVFPIITVDGTDPELDVMSEDMNTVIGVHYLKDVAYAMGDFGFHQTRPNKYYDPDEDGVQNDAPIRVVFGTYCAQIDETNIAMIRHIYDGDDPAPFADQFETLPMKEIHWDRVSGTSTLASPGGQRI